ncbi:hypothetical protein [uncultured Microscilla sp.]|uniref:hypothetical protein n=1 Tax=uncultured Microscilla sp. TaxID=432653 RepID=UPI0026126EA5|nr:hypothetical protein [uncultured Microscilla sp.]
MIKFVLITNTIWFALGFHAFSIRHKVFAKLVVPRKDRDTPVFSILAESGRFLGGFNLAFTLFNVLLLFNLNTFPSDKQRAILLLVFAIAHGSQFAFNVPIAIQNTRGEGVWQVLKGTMLFIFVTDFVMMTLNLALSILFAW